MTGELKPAIILAPSVGVSAATALLVMSQDERLRVVHFYDAALARKPIGFAHLLPVLYNVSRNVSSVACQFLPHRWIRRIDKPDLVKQQIGAFEASLLLNNVRMGNRAP